MKWYCEEISKCKHEITIKWKVRDVDLIKARKKKKKRSAHAHANTVSVVLPQIHLNSPNRTCCVLNSIICISSPWLLLNPVRST